MLYKSDGIAGCDVGSTVRAFGPGRTASGHRVDSGGPRALLGNVHRTAELDAAVVANAPDRSDLGATLDAARRAPRARPSLGDAPASASSSRSVAAAIAELGVPG